MEEQRTPQETGSPSGEQLALWAPGPNSHWQGLQTELATACPALQKCPPALCAYHSSWPPAAAEDPPRTRGGPEPRRLNFN